LSTPVYCIRLTLFHTRDRILPGLLRRSRDGGSVERSRASRGQRHDLPLCRPNQWHRAPRRPYLYSPVHKIWAKGQRSGARPPGQGCSRLGSPRDSTARAYLHQGSHEAAEAFLEAPGAALDHHNKSSCGRRSKALAMARRAKRPDLARAEAPVGMLGLRSTTERLTTGGERRPWRGSTAVEYLRVPPWLAK
jgi:hypothetical protein